MKKAVLLYSSEAWTVTNIIRNKLQVFINRYLGNILKIWWPKTISNVELWKRNG